MRPCPPTVEDDALSHSFSFISSHCCDVRPLVLGRRHFIPEAELSLDSTTSRQPPPPVLPRK